MNPARGFPVRVSKLLGNFGIGAVLAGAAEFAKGGSSILAQFVAYPVAFVLSEVFSHYTAEHAGSIINDDLITRFGKSPLELNHNLRQLYADSARQAINEGVRLSYEKEKKKPLGEPLQKKLMKLGDRFYDSYFVKDANEHHTKEILTSGNLISLLDEQQPDACKKLYQGENDRIGKVYHPRIFFHANDFPKDFIDYFDEHFCSIVRILFIEGLKTKHYEHARVAYEQMMAEETYRSISALKSDIDKLKETGTYAQSKYAVIKVEEFTVSLENIREPGDLRLLFHKGLTEYYDRFDRKLDDLLELAKETHITVEHIDLKTDRIEKGITRNMVISYALVAVALVFVAFAFIHFYKDSFDFKLYVRDKRDQPIKNGFLYLDVKGKASSEGIHQLAKITDGFVSFEKVSKNFLDNDTAKITLYGDLEDKYRIADSSKYLPLKSSNYKTIVLYEDTLKAKPRQKTESTIKQTAVNISAPASLPKLLCNIEGFKFQDKIKDFNYITFHAMKGNTIGFTGNLEIGGIEGIMIAESSHTLIVKSGNVTGSLTLNESCTSVTGLLTITSNNASINIDFNKVDN